jgi:hypothetical protein
VTLNGPDEVRSVVTISEETTVRDVATTRYHLYWRITKRNGVSVVPFTTEVHDGDIVDVESGRGAIQYEPGHTGKRNRTARQSK